MTDIRLFLALIALLSMALFYARFGVKSALTPLCAVATVALGLSLFGGLGLLRLGGWLLYGFAAFCAGFLLWEWLAKKRPPPKPGFGFWFFAALSVVFILLLRAKQPLFTDWDEFSFWGTAAKLQKLYGQLYTTAPVGWGWLQSQKPAYVAFGYFFQFFGAEFSEWQTYAACDIFQLGLMAALFLPFDGKLRDHWPAALPVGLLALLTPYVFQHYQTFQSVSPVYLGTLGDIPLGLCFAAALICGLGHRAPGCLGRTAAQTGHRSLADLAPAVAALGLVTMTKDTGFALALVAAVILAVDWLITARAGLAKAERKKTWLPGLAWLGAGLLAVLVPFIAWEGYTGALSGTSRLDSAVTTGGVGILEMPVAFVRDLLNPAGMTGEKQAVFTHVTGGMAKSFVTAPTTMLGSGLVIMLLALGCLALAAFLYKDRTFRLRVAAFGVLSTLGALAWQLLIAMTYIYVMRADQAMMLDSYNRYVNPYYIGWLLGAVAWLCAALVQGKSRLVPLAKAGLVAAAALVLLRMALLIPPAYTVLGVNTQEYNRRREFDAHADELKEYLDPNGRTYIVTSDSDQGLKWFMYCHQLLPWQVDYSFGGGVDGRLLFKEKQPDGTTLETELDADALAQHLADTGCTTLYIDNADAHFIETYGTLFTDDLDAYQSGRANIYVVNTTGDTLALEPLYWQSLE